MSRLPRALVCVVFLLLSCVPVGALACDPPTGSFCGDYFAGRDLMAPVRFSAPVDSIKFDWQLASPDPTVPVDNFSARWKGWFAFADGDVAFRLVGDDGVRLKLDGKVVLDGWKDQAATEYHVTIPITGGNHLVEVEYYDAGGLARVEADWETARRCDPPSGTFCVAYFDNKTLTGNPRLIGNETRIAHSWGGGAPDPGLPADNFSGRWQGRFTFEAGDYLFRVLADDGVRLKVDGTSLIDGWRNQAATEYRAPMTLSAGEHLIEVEYYEASGSARLEADWDAVQDCGIPEGRFCAAYYGNKTLSGTPRHAAEEVAADHSWSTGSPAPGVPADNFSARWQGSFDFAPGTHEFQAVADDGVRIRVDDEPLIEAWPAAGQTHYTKLRWLSGSHRVTVEYFEATGNAQIKATWNLVAPASTTPPSPIGSHAGAPIGTNLSDWKDWSTEQPFIDVFKTSRSWIPQAPGVWDTGESSRLDLDANGWVRSLPSASDSTVRYRSVATLLLVGADLNGIRPGGDYTVLYEGEGRIDYGQGARRNAALSQPGRDVITVDKDNPGGLQLNIALTDPQHNGNYLRNIRVIPGGLICDDDPLAFCSTETDPACQRSACRSMEAAAQERLFHPLFLRTLVNYRELRFTGPMSTNVISASQPQPVDWADRSTPSKARWSDQAGVPLEVVAALSNQVHADPWVNMPHRASDGYMRQAARLLHDRLEPGRTVYLEYANEIWNTAFSAGGWVEQQALAAWPASPDSAYTKRINWYGKRTAEMCDIWKAEWAEDDGRVICVLSAQAANAFTANAALDCRLWSEAPCQAHGIAAIAIAPYFGHYLGTSSAEAEVSSWTTDPDGGLGALFDELSTGGQLPGGPSGGAVEQARLWTMQYGDLSRRRSLTLIAYEGGQHLVGVGNVLNNAKLTGLFVAANRDPRMGPLYDRLLGDWRAAGGELFVNFSNVGQYGRYGSWGVIETMQQHTSPKLDALLRYIRATNTP